MAFSRHGPDIEAPSGPEDLGRYSRGADDILDTGARGMHQTATGYFRCADRFPRGRRTSGQPVGEDIVRLSVSAWLRRGQELRQCVLHFSLGVPGACYTIGPRRGSGPGVSPRDPRAASRVPESARDQDQVSPVAGTPRGLSRSVPAQSCRVDVLKHASFLKNLKLTCTKLFFLQ